MDDVAVGLGLEDIGARGIDHVAATEIEGSARIAKEFSADPDRLTDPVAVGKESGPMAWKPTPGSRASCAWSRLPAPLTTTKH